MRVPETRAGRIMVDGSPEFEFDNPAIAASASWVINLADNTAYGRRIFKYLPLDFIEVLNDQPQDIDVILNDVSVRIVPGGAIRTVEGRKIVAVKITNRDAVNAIAINTINVILKRKGTDADSEAQRKVRESVR